MEDRSHTAPSSAFSVGPVFSRAFSTLFGHPALFFGLTFVAWVPGTLLQLLWGTKGNPFAKFAIWIISFSLSMIVQGATAYAALRVLRDEEATIGSSFSNGLSRLGSLVLLSLFVGVAYFLGGLVLLGLPTILAGYFGAMLGLLLLFIAIPIVMCMWYVAVPACVVERLGAFESLQRSAALTKGYRWKVFGLLTLVAIAFFVIFGIGAIALHLFFFWSKIAAALATQVLLLIPQAFWCVMIPITYYSLREAKEGVSVDSLAKVFD